MSGLGFGDDRDEDLLARYADPSTSPSDREVAFLELVDRYERRVYAICYRHFGNHADAEDATQDTFLSVARKAEQFAGDSKLSTWIYRIAVNACNDLGRKYQRRPQDPVADVAAAAGGATTATEDDALAASETATEVQQALGQLDELSRTLIVLCAIEGQSYAEVSEILDLPVGTIKSRVFRARAKLAEILGPVLRPEEGELPRQVAGDVAPRTAHPDGASGPRGPPRR